MIKKRLVVANWKMNPSSAMEARELFSAVKKVSSTLKNIKLVICPPDIYFYDLKRLSRGKNIALGAQNAFGEKAGQVTGEIPPSMLAEIGIEYIIVGHSERRAFGETDEEINRKLKALLELGFKCILCVGEKERDEDGEYLGFIRNELREDLRGVNKKRYKNLIIAYEPVWAIGKDSQKADTPESVEQVSVFIKRVVSMMVGRDIGLNLSILYGGSVDEDNAGDFLKTGGLDGLLVGRASLNKNKFSGILKKVDKI